MRTPHPMLPTVLAMLALAIAVAGYVAPRPGTAAAATTVEPVPGSIQAKPKNSAALALSTSARLDALESRADDVETRVVRVERATASLASLKTHAHAYTPMPGYGIVNLYTLKTMLDRMDPSDGKASLPIAWDGVRIPAHLPQTGPPVAP